MYKDFVNFVKYNNAFTIIFGLFFFSFGVSFAASPELRDGVYASQETVSAIDNSYLISSDLDNFNFNLRINSITEDDSNYYVIYSYQTLVIENSIWQNKEIEKTLTVVKSALEGKDLGLYVAKELGENINYELSYLKRVKELEKEKGESQKIITTEYSGLIGKLLNPRQEVIEGYNPVIPEVVPEVPATVESNPEDVVVSTPYTEPKNENLVEETATSSETETAPIESPLPKPEEMIDEELVKEVVEGLLSNEATSTPSEVTVPPVTEVVPASTQETVPENEIENIPVPEVVAEPSQ